MAEQRAHAVRHFGAEDVLELAGARFDFGFVADREHVHEKPLGEPVAADHIAGARFARGRELALAVVDRDQADAAPWCAISFRHCTAVKSCDSMWPRGFAARPEMLQHFVEILILFGGKDQRFFDAAVVQIEAAVGQLPGVLVVRDHHDGAALRVKIAQEI